MEPAFDVLILGAGAAGLTAALRLHELAPDLSVAVAVKDKIFGGSTALAQGGIAAVLDPVDSPQSHIADTEKAGAGLCRTDTVRFVVDRAASAIDWLVRQGVSFDRREQDDNYALTLEGGHSHRRIVHAGDATGRAVSSRLDQRLREAQVTCLEHHTAIDLIVGTGSTEEGRHCKGALILNEITGAVRRVCARRTILATGGASGVYLHSTNRNGATGDGIAMAWRAGCRIANLEFNQFHPTCFYQPGGSSFLISEALRGEGGRLRRVDGTLFMQDYDSRGELAPRDIVARAINNVMKCQGDSHVLLDLSHLPAGFARRRFPTIAAHCLSFGIDIARQPIPVVPAAHYTCGGVVADLAGRSDLDALYVLGEAAWTGLHGANRLASNSLLECIVFGLAAAEDIAAHLRSDPPADLRMMRDIRPGSPPSRASRTIDTELVTLWRTRLRQHMWHHVGITRCPQQLEIARREISHLRCQAEAAFSAEMARRDVIELRNLAQVAELMIQSAQDRRESLGSHYWAQRTDAGSRPPEDTILRS